MPDFSTLILFAGAALVLTATPGPDMLLIASRSVSQGRSAGFLTYAGIAAGTYCHALAAGLGLSQLFVAVPVAYEIVRWAGCAYLLYLAYKTLRSEGSAFAPSTALRKISDRRIFTEGLLTNLLNPKAAIFYIAVLPTFVDDSRPVLAQTVLLTAIYVAIATIIHAVIVVLAGTLEPFLNDARRERISRRLLSAMLAVVALWFAWSTKR